MPEAVRTSPGGDVVVGDSGEAPTDSVEAFASDLQHLRVNAGSPTYDRLKNETGISRSIVTSAFAGRTLPSARTVDAIVRACGGDSGSWLERRKAISKLGAQRSTTPLESAGAVDQPRVWRRSTAIGVIIGAFVLGAVGSWVGASFVMTQAHSAQLAELGVADGPQILVETGLDPALTPCVDDAKVAAGDTRVDNSLIEIIWSNKCYAGWGRITRYDGLGEGNTVTIAIYPETAPTGPGRQEATEHDVQGAYTTLVVRPSPDTLLCAEGSFTVDGKRIDLGDPLCI